MMPTNLEEHIKNLAYEGADFETLVNELNRLSPDFPPQTVAFVRKKLDDYIVAYQLGLEAKHKSLNQVFYGILLLVVGFSVFLYVQSNNLSSYSLRYGLLLVGAWVAWKGYAKWKQPVSHFIPNTTRFQKRSR